MTSKVMLDTTTCGVAKTLKVIGAKWTMLVLRDLMDGTKRFGELQRSLAGISPKTLSERLQQLEKDGLVERQVFAEVPLRVEYSLTERGKSLQEIIAAMRSWGEATAVNRERVEVEVGS